MHGLFIMHNFQNLSNNVLIPTSAIDMVLIMDIYVKNNDLPLESLHKSSFLLHPGTIRPVWFKFIY